MPRLQSAPSRHAVHPLRCLEGAGFRQRLPSYAEATPDLINAILEEAGRFCENVLQPLNRSGDEEGCHFEQGTVTTPKGFKEAYNKYVEGGWTGLACDPEYRRAGAHFARELRG